MNDTMKYIQRFDLNKLDFQGFNEIGFDKDGFDHQSYDKQGYHRETGFNLLGFNRLGDHDGIISFKFDGYNREGYNRAGFNCHGINKYGYDYHGFASGWIFYCRAMSESRCRNMEYEYPYLKREVVAFSRGKRCHEISCELKCGCSYLNSNFSLGLSFELLQRNCSCGKDGLIQCTCDHISSRKEINDLTSEKLKTYINAVKRSVIEKHTSLSKWQNLAMMYADFAPHHQGSLVSLPWIRMFLLTVESELGVSIPYFDWTVVAGVPLSSIVWSSNYFGTNGTAKNHCIEDNPFVDEFKSIWYPCLKRNLNLKVSLPNAIQVESIMRMADYRDFEMNMELFSSIFGQFLGGHGLTPYAVYDPLFISHLAFIDKLWFEWETRHRTFPASKRYVVLRPFGKVCDEVLLESYKMCVSYMPISNRLPCLKPLNISKSDIEVKKVDCDTDYLLFAKIWLQEYLKTILSANLSIMRYCPDIQTVPERYNLKIWHSRSDRISTWKALSQNLTSQVIDIAYANEKEITYVQLCAKFNFEERCGPGEEVMSCSENPCKTAVCVSNPLLNCSHTVCNECKAKFYSNDSNISTNCIEIGCYDGSIIRRNMEVWIPSICNQCTCNDGKISCGLVTCEVPFCSHPRRSLNECCSKCDGCSYKGRNYEDGDIFDVLNDICIKCSCSRGNIYCRRTICPTLESCPSSDVVTLNGACCPLCSSCGTRSHGDTWIKTENCKFCKCQYGEEICSKIECQSINCTSANAEVLHKCCSSCGKDCILNNQRIHNGDTFHLSACEQCKCIQGALKCATKICPDFDKCTKEAIIPSTDSKCCPSCATDTIGPCTLYDVGLSFHPIDDPCFICKCNDALKWFCSWLECRPLSCPVKFRKKAQNECCPKCDYCFTEDGRKYKNEENWISKFDPCVSCTCVHGVKQCRSIEFLCKSLDCGLNKKPILKPGHCCPICK